MLRSLGQCSSLEPCNLLVLQGDLDFLARDRFSSHPIHHAPTGRAIETWPGTQPTTEIQNRKLPVKVLTQRNLPIQTGFQKIWQPWCLTIRPWERFRRNGQT
jgi:hypothetical protein